MIHWSKSTSRDLICPVCGLSGRMTSVLTASSAWITASALELFACPACRCKFFPDLVIPEYRSAADSVEDESYLKFYLEVGAGIDQLVRHVFAVPMKRGARYLEIGCGFGFGLDFARRMLGLEVLGIDPSPFAASGARQLEVPSVSGYLEEATDLGGRSFDLIVASEVIEHVHDPRRFVATVARHLSPEGVFILTTPNAGSIRPETSPGVLTPLLSTGWHYILHSQQSLIGVLRDTGFPRVETEVREHTIVAAATRGNAPVNLAADVDRALLRTYFDDRRRTVASNNWLWTALAYRQLKELTNSARYSEALELYEEIRTRFTADYGFGLGDPFEQWLRPLDEESFSSFATRYPMCLCGVAYSRGILALNHERAPLTATRYFALAKEYGGLLRDALHTVGADDAETEMLAQRSQILGLRCTAETAPTEAAAKALGLLSGSNASVQISVQWRTEILSLFPHLVNLGQLAAAEVLADAVEETLRANHSRAQMDDKPRAELHRALGLLELNRRHRPRCAALHFALAERFLNRCIDLESPSASAEIWGLRHDRLLAWVVAGNAQRALRAGRPFTRPPKLETIPKSIQESAAGLIAQAAASLGH